MRVNGAGNVIPPSAHADFPEASLSAEAEAPTGAAVSSSSTASHSDLQHFVTFDEKGREIHFVAVDAEDADADQQVAQVGE